MFNPMLYSYMILSVGGGGGGVHAWGGGGVKVLTDICKLPGTFQLCFSAFSM